MIKIGKYEFNDEDSAKSKIEALGDSHNHSIVTLGHIVIEEGEYDEDHQETKAPTLSNKYHIDVCWKDLEDHPYGWKSFAVTPSNDGVHSFWGIDYQDNKF